MNINKLFKILLPWKFLSKKKQKKLVLASFILILVLAPVVVYTLQHAGKTEAAWFNSNWSFRSAINITEHAGAETNVYINFTGSAAINTSDSSKFQADCGDLRFTDTNGSVLSYYIASGCGTSSTVVHVFLKNFPAGAQTMYLYYGNPSASNGFSSSDFATEASGYTIGSLGSEEAGPAPVAHWKLNEGSGSVAKDSSPNGLNGTITGASWQPKDKCINDKCVKFDGSTTYVSVGNNSNLNPTTGFTMEAWIKVTSVASSTNYNIIAKQDWANKLGYRLAITGYGCSTNCLFMGVGDGTNRTETVSGINLNDLGNWHHVVGVFNSGNMYIYIDGVQKFSTTTPVTTISNTSGILGIGRHSGSGEFFPGFIDDVKIYKYAKTASQVKADYVARGSSGVSVSFGASDANKNLTNGLVGYWKMDEASWATDCSTTSIVDASGYGNNGKSCDAGAGPAGGAVGKFGYGGSFDGTNDAVDVADNSSINITGSITLSAWIKPTATSNNYEIINKKQDTSDRGYRLRQNWSGLTFEWSDGITQQIKLDSPLSLITTNAWQHVVATYDQHIAKLYINGSLVASAAHTEPIASSATYNLTIGNYLNNYTAYAFSGSIDEARVYNRALSSGEVNQLYNYAPGPVAYYNFEEGQGSNVNDSSGNGISGTITGAPWKQGKFGKALSFNGTSGNTVSMGNPSALNFGTGSFTYSLYVYVDQPLDAYDMPIYKGGASAGNPGFEMELGTGYWIATISDGSTSVASYFTETAPVLGRWVYLTAVIDRNSNTFSTYIDGLKWDSTDITSFGSVSNGSDSLALSRSDNYFFRGKIDEVKFYNYARTGGQIVSDMNASHPNVGSPVGSAYGHWKFDEGYGINANNSGNGGNLLQMALTAMSNPAIVNSGWSNNGKFGKALSFDGVDDYTKMSANDTAFDANDSPITLSAWINTSVAGYYFSKGGVSGGWGIYHAPGGVIQFISKIGDNSNAVVVSTTKNYPGNTWLHVAAVINVDTSILANNSVTIYVDGVAVSANTTRTNLPVVSTAVARIGARGNAATPSGFYGGLIDEVKIYNFALTAADVKLDYNHSSAQTLGAFSDTLGLTGGQIASNSASALYCVPGDTASCAPPIGEWNFEEGNGATSNDSSGNEHTATFDSLTTFGQGKFGKSASFESGGNITVADVVNDIKTIQFWLYYEGSGNKELFRLDGCGSVSSCIFSQTGSDITLTDGFTNPKVYINGVLTSTLKSAKIWQLVTVTADSMNSGNNILMGYHTEGSFKGRFDQVRLYDYVRTPAQVAYDYNRGAPVAHWKLNECQGLFVKDSINNNTGALNGLGDVIGLDSFTGSVDLTSHAADFGGTWSQLGTKLGSGNGFDAILINNTLYLGHHSPVTGYERRFYRLGSGNDGDVDLYLTDYGGDKDEDGSSLGDNYSGGIMARYGTVTSNDKFYYAYTDGSTIYLYKYDTIITAITTGSVTNPGANQPIRIRFQVSGVSPTTLRVKAWRATDAEPGSWAIDTTDNTANNQRSSGGFGVTGETYSDSASSYYTYVDNFLVARGGGGAQPTAGTCTTSGTAWANGSTGKFNASLNFDGTDDYVSVGDSDALDVQTGYFSISSWIKFAGPSYIAGQGSPVVMKGRNASTFTYSLSTQSGSNPALSFSLYDGTNNPTLNSNFHLTNDVWTHVTAVYDGVLKIYINGRLDNSGSAGSYTTAANTTGPLEIGSWPFQHGTRGFFNGQIDDVRVYNYPLTLSQIKQVINQGAGVRFGPTTGMP